MVIFLMQQTNAFDTNRDIIREITVPMITMLALLNHRDALKCFVLYIPLDSIYQQSCLIVYSYLIKCLLYYKT